MDVVASLALPGSSSWDDSERPYHNLTTGPLGRMKKVIDNNRDRNTMETRKLASEASGSGIPQILDGYDQIDHISLSTDSPSFRIGNVPDTQRIRSTVYFCKKHSAVRH